MLSDELIEERTKLLDIQQLKEIRNLPEEQKRLRRLEKNRVSARRTRQRKRQYYLDLEKNFEKLKEQNEGYEKKVNEKNREIEKLKEIIAKQKRLTQNMQVGPNSIPQLKLDSISETNSYFSITNPSTRKRRPQTISNSNSNSNNYSNSKQIKNENDMYTNTNNQYPNDLFVGSIDLAYPILFPESTCMEGDDLSQSNNNTNRNNNWNNSQIIQTDMISGTLLGIFILFGLIFHYGPLFSQDAHNKNQPFGFFQQNPFLNAIASPFLNMKQSKKNSLFSTDQDLKYDNDRNKNYLNEKNSNLQIQNLKQSSDQKNNCQYCNEQKIKQPSFYNTQNAFENEHGFGSRREHLLAF